jgi:hypothetical protein
MLNRTTSVKKGCLYIYLCKLKNNQSAGIKNLHLQGKLPHRTRYSTSFFRRIMFSWLECSCSASSLESRTSAHALFQKNNYEVTVDSVSDTRLTIFVLISCRVNGLLKTVGYEGSFPSLKLKDIDPWSQSSVRHPEPSVQPIRVGENNKTNP